jgi:hypothetical protein
MAKDRWIGQSETPKAMRIVADWLNGLSSKALSQIDSTNRSELVRAITAELIRARASAESEEDKKDA